MDFSLTDEQASLADMVDRLFAQEHDPQTRRKLAADASFVPATMWPEMAELGLLGLFIPEALGGMAETGLHDSAAAAHLVAKSVGRHLVAEPFISTAVIAASLIAEVGSPELQASLLPGLAEGRVRIAVAAGPWTEDEHATAPEAVRQADGAYRLEGQTSAIDANDAQWLVAPAWVQAAGGLALCLISADGPGVILRRGRALDGTEVVRVDLRGAAVTGAQIIAQPENGGGAWRRALHRGIAALTAEAVGAMERLLEMTVDYVKVRKQFGHPLADFQALRHYLADMRTAVEQATSLSLAATAASLEPDAATAAQTISAAKYMIGRLSRLVAEQSVQLHAGIGMTEELSVGHYFRRLIAIDATWGNAQQHLDRYVLRMG